MTDRQFVDTNIWVYALDAADPVKQARARAVLDPDAGNDLVVSAQVLGEFYVTITRKLAIPVPEAVARDLVAAMARLPVVPLDGRLVADAIAGSSAWQLSYWDALVVAAAQAAGANRLLTEDLQAGRVIEGVVIEDPFRSEPAQ